MELTIENLIKIIIGILVVVVVILGIYFFFRGSLIDFFENLVPNKTVETGNFLLGILR